MDTTMTRTIGLIKDLGNGLVLRHASPADAEALAAFNAMIHSDDGPDKPDERLAAWTRDLMTKPHPTFAPDDFILVEDTTSGKIASCVCLISQAWTYAGIPFKVGRPELVGTLPEYRNRGLVRAQFDAIHQMSAERGEMLQAITGIPYYYRIFGYEMAMNLGGGRVGYLALMPALAENASEPYTFRSVEDGDLEFIQGLYEHGTRRNLVSCEWNEALWRYERDGKDEKNINRNELRIILDADGSRVGLLAHPYYPWSGGAMLGATLYELAPGVSWGVVTPSVIRYLCTAGEAVSKRQPGGKPFGAYGLWLGESHPSYEAAKDRLPRTRKPYAWYLRVADLAGFIGHIRPVLEKRLADSILTGHTGEIKITFYRSGLRMKFEKGRLETVEAWKPEPQGHSGDAAFPGLTFLQALFGYRSLDELSYAFADIWFESDDARNLLAILFPRQSSDLWAVS